MMKKFILYIIERAFARFFILKMIKKKKYNKDIIAEKIEKIAMPLCQSENIELVDTKCFFDQKKMIIRISIDTPKGVTINDCVNINRQLGDLIDVQMEELESYRLEISSPGPSRPLKKESDFEKFKGHIVQIETSKFVNGQKRFKGILNGIKKGVVELGINKKTYSFKMELINKARLA